MQSYTSHRATVSRRATRVTELCESQSYSRFQPSQSRSKTQRYRRHRAAASRRTVVSRRAAASHRATASRRVTASHRAIVNYRATAKPRLFEYIGDVQGLSLRARPAKGSIAESGHMITSFRVHLFEYNGDVWVLSLKDHFLSANRKPGLQLANFEERRFSACVSRFRPSPYYGG